MKKPDLKSKGLALCNALYKQPNKLSAGKLATPTKNNNQDLHPEQVNTSLDAELDNNRSKFTQPKAKSDRTSRIANFEEAKLRDLLGSLISLPAPNRTVTNLYEKEKQKITSKNLSPAEYEIEIKKLCRRLGI